MLRYITLYTKLINYRLYNTIFTFYNVLFKTYLKKDLFYLVITIITTITYIFSLIEIDIVIYKISGLTYRLKNATIYFSYIYF